MSDAAVQIEGLGKTYRIDRRTTRIALAGLTLTAPRGAITAILGPNGAGKSTTVEICAGLRHADRGTVTVFGLDPDRDARQLKAKVGVMPQSGSTTGLGVAGSTKCAEALQLFASYFADPIPPGDLIERLALSDVASTAWRRMSGGEQQRLSLALAIIGRPEVVFLDEPTAGLDVQARLAVHDLIGELRAAGVSVILTTHLMDEAEQLADHVVIIDGGRAVAAGSPNELTATDDDSVSFDGPTGLALTSLLSALPAGSEATESPAGHYRVSGRVDPAFLATLTAWCASHGVMPRGLTTAERSLEDVFVELTGRGLRP